VQIANVDMAAAWDVEAPGWIEYEDAYARSSLDLWSLFLTGVELNANDRVLDLGCGTGVKTRAMAQSLPQGSIVAIDLSPEMATHAQQGAARAGLTNIEFVAGDAQVYPFGEDVFDLAVSSFGSMFYMDPVAAFGNVRCALRPGGRLALLTWRALAENEWLIAFRNAMAVGRDLPVPPSDAPGPFGLADPGHVRRVLSEAGFSNIVLDPLDAELDFGADAAAAYAYVSAMGVTRGLTAELDDVSRLRALQSLRETLKAHETPNGVRMSSATWRITAERA